MSWRFRKIFSLGLFRTTLSSKGLGYSIGIPGFRYTISSVGKKYLTIGIPGTGLSITKSLDKEIEKPVINSSQLSTMTKNQEILKKLKESK